ncbi:MAG TPA: hypothetical protein PLY62_08850 [Bacteroidales bacterium]|nr:hypothetical protein [Bacteroidales bacterium]
MLIGSGIPAETVRKPIGHCSDGSMTQRYFRSENFDRVLLATETAIPIHIDSGKSEEEFIRDHSTMQ